MKGKITIVLLSLVLVFGMIAASCDNGTQPANPYPPATQTGPNTTTASDYKPSEADPSNIIAKKIKAINALAGGIKLGVHGSTPPVWDDANKVLKVPGGSAAAFSITFSDTTYTHKAGEKIKITYACVVESYDSAKANNDGTFHLIVKKLGTLDTADVSNKYPRLDDTSKVTGLKVTVETKTVTIEPSGGTDVFDGISFQYNSGDGDGVYYIKVTKVEKG